MADILVVEDEIAIAEMLLMLLEEEGHIVRTAADGRAGLAAALERRPDLVLTDTTMPTMTGPELVAALQGEAALAGVPVIVMSALPMAEVLRTYPRWAPFIQKPFRVYQVAAMIENTLGTSLTT